MEKSIDNNLLNELINYSEHKHAEIVYRKCLRKNKFNLAKRIKIKYNLSDPKDDVIDALKFALIGLNNNV